MNYSEYTQSAQNSAFPVYSDENNNGGCDGLGLSKREMFAAMAMQAKISTQTKDMIESDYWSNPEDVAKSAVQYADALIAELNKPVEE